MGTMHLSDTISYLDDIQPHLLTMLYAGVGSGKNHFINQLMTGYTDKRHDGTEVKLDPLYILLITSRPWLFSGSPQTDRGRPWASGR